MEIFTYMEHGTGKTVSEDSILVNGDILKEGFFLFAEAGACIAIADGVGGNPGGREASEFVIRKFSENALLTDTKALAERINKELLNYAKSIPGKEQMATTASAILLSGGVPVKILHVGNTRVFAIQGEYLKQLTTDHTVTELLRQRGEYEAADAAPGNEITACFGAGASSMLNRIQIMEVDRRYTGFVLTSDGIHDYLSEEDLEDFVSAGCYSEESFSELAIMAKENGSEDDKSVVIIRL